MRDRMTRAEGRAFVKRWRLVNEREREELRATPVAVKFRQLAALMGSARAMGWEEALAEGEEEVRQRWNRLWKFYGA